MILQQRISGIITRRTLPRPLATENEDGMLRLCARQPKRMDQDAVNEVRQEIQELVDLACI